MMMYDISKKTLRDVISKIKLMGNMSFILLVYNFALNKKVK